MILVIANAGNVVLELIAVYTLDYGIAGSAWSTWWCRSSPPSPSSSRWHLTSRPRSPDDRTGPRCRRCSWPAATSWCGWAGSSR